MPTVLVTGDRHADYTIEEQILQQAGIDLEEHNFALRGTHRHIR